MQCFGATFKVQLLPLGALLAQPHTIRISKQLLALVLADGFLLGFPCEEGPNSLGVSLCILMALDRNTVNQKFCSRQVSRVEAPMNIKTLRKQTHCCDPFCVHSSLPCVPPECRQQALHRHTSEPILLRKRLDGLPKSFVLLHGFCRTAKVLEYLFTRFWPTTTLASRTKLPESFRFEVVVPTWMVRF